MVVAVLFNDTDVDHSNGLLAVTGVTSVSGGIASIVGTGVQFVPSTGVCGTGLFSYYAMDTSGGTSNLATGTISIACNNTAPVAVDQSLTINEDNVALFTLTSGASDIDTGDTISFSGFMVSPSNGSISNTGVYTPNANFCGTDAFVFQLTDSF